eukprot:1617352-Amphidinium_carterae.1
MDVAAPQDAAAEEPGGAEGSNKNTRTVLQMYSPNKKYYVLVSEFMLGTGTNIGAQLGTDMINASCAQTCACVWFCARILAWRYHPTVFNYRP